MYNIKIVMIAAIAVVGLIGCDGKNSPADPANLTPEQIEAAKQEEKKAMEEERAHQRANDRPRPRNSVEEEERRARGNR